MKEKKSFLLYKDQNTTFDRLTEEEAGKLIKAIFKFQNDGELPNFEDRVLDLAFAQIKATFDRDNISYRERCEKNRENAITRWNKEKSSDAIACDRIQANAIYADSDRDSDSDRDRDRDSDSDRDVISPVEDNNYYKEAFMQIYEAYPNKIDGFDMNFCFEQYISLINEINIGEKKIKLGTTGIEVYYRQYLEENRGKLPLSHPSLNDFFREVFPRYIIDKQIE